MRIDDFIKSQIALAAWRDGHEYGGAQAMIMVAHAIANRQKQGWGNWLKIIQDIPLHSCKNLDEQSKEYPDPMDPNFIKLLNEIDYIYDGISVDPLTPAAPPVRFTAQRPKGGVYWADLNGITRDWFLSNIAQNHDNHHRVANMGTLYFWD